MQEKPKRKTHTSSAVKNRYNAKTYKVYSASIKPPLFDRIDKYQEKESLSRPQFLERAINALEESEKSE